MATAPKPLYKTRLRHHRFTGGTGGDYNQLHDAAGNSRAASKRPRPPTNDVDTRQNISDYGWRELLKASRYVTANFGPIRGAIRQMVTYTIGNAWQVQYVGRNRAWGDKMEEAIYEADKICDIRGSTYDFKTGLCLDLYSIIRDGDCNVLLTGTEDGNGWPQFQGIPAHRVCTVGNVAGDRIVEGAFAGRIISNGTIMDDAGRVIGFRVALGGAEYTDIAAGQMFQDYEPEFYDQGRGVPRLASAIFDASDLGELRDFLKTSLKAEASLTFIEHNEAGEAMTSIGSLLTGANVTTADDGTTSTNPAVEYFDDNTIRYFRAGTNSKIEAPNLSRPGRDAQAFSFEILRSAFEALGWPIELYDPSALGGANIRLRVSQAVRTLESLQHIVSRIARRKHSYMIAKLIKIGVLEPDIDWWKIEHKKPRNLTVDNGHDVKADMELYAKGIITMDELTSRMGQYWEEVQDQRIAEAKRKKERCAEAGVDPIEVQMMTPNGNVAPTQTAEPKEDDAEETEKEPNET